MDTSPTIPVLSSFQTTSLLHAKECRCSLAQVSLDLGITEVTVGLEKEGVVLPDGSLLAWPLVAEIDRENTVCFQVINGDIRPIRFFCEETARTRSLLPTATAPALMISGFLMHRIKNIDPLKAAGEMVRAVSPLRGRVLDTATGLGYTALHAAQTAHQVITIEHDSCVERIARINPWSRRLFDHPAITRLQGDCFERLEEFESGFFSRVIHDPPAVNIAGNLYSLGFYRRVYRVLDDQGSMFHYIGDPRSPGGSRATRGVVRRLHDAGFTGVRPMPEAFGVTAYKATVSVRTGSRRRRTPSRIRFF